jgi:hypothetical protein
MRTRDGNDSVGGLLWKYTTKKKQGKAKREKAKKEPGRPL